MTVTSGYQRGSIRLIQFQGVGQLAHRRGMGCAAGTTFQVGDGAPAHTSTFGKLFLRKYRNCAMPLEK
jgi:hypothetical protein